MWIPALINTCIIVCTVVIISMILGSFTALAAWWSNSRWAYYIPLLVLSVPPWLLAYNLSEYGYVNPWIGAAASLGICSSVYPHCVVLASLSDRAHKSWEMMVVARGKNLKSLFVAVWPSLRLSFLPSVAIVAAECISDFGVSDFYGLNTVTTLVFNTWTSTWDGFQVIYGLLLLVVMGMFLGKLSAPASVSIYGDRISDSSRNYFGMLAVSPAILLLAFVLHQSLRWVSLGASFQSTELVEELTNTVTLVFVVSVLCALVMILYVIRPGTWIEKTGLVLYSIPSTVIGACTLYLFGSLFDMMTLLVFAIVIRYYSLSVNTLSVSVNTNVKAFEVIELFTSTKLQQVYLKLQTMLPSLILGICVVALDVMRELPLSMILQPPNYQTLALRMNYIARSETIPDLGYHSLIVILLGVILCSVIIRIIYVADKKFNK